jgi:hypothetical protein
MGRLLSGRGQAPLLACALLLAALAALLQPLRAAADGIEAGADVLAVSSNGTTSFLNNGLGAVRFDSDHQGLQLDNVRLGYRGTAAEIVHFTVEAVSYGDRDANPIDLTEAFAEIRPFPHGPWRSRLKIGAFYAPISLENRLPGWRSAYSLSPSAINTWVGEELRTFGAEYDLDWLGRQRGHDWELSLGGSVYGWNESAGELMSERGWAIHDRQSTLFAKFGTAEPGAIADERLLTDAGANRAGYYVDGAAKYLDALELRALHYDNRANPGAYSEEANNYPWQTQFNSAGVRWTPSTHWTLISQWLHGSTCSDAEDDEYYCWSFESEFLLLSWQLGPTRLSGRYERFDMHQSVPSGAPDGYRDQGHAWTFACERAFNRYLSVALEFIQADTSLNERLEFGLPQGATERELELALRLHL